MAFQQGLSGLNASSKQLDVISNNIANASNIGFKQSGSQFSDVYAAALNGSASNLQVGIGTTVAAISQQFTQGNITATNNPLDVAINGNGFFRMESADGSIAYTRAGQFSIDKNGYLVNSQGYKVTGYPATTDGTILPASPQALTIDTSDLMPQQTGTIKMGFNLDSRKTVPANAWVAGTASPDATTYTNSTSVTVYDSLGNSHAMTLYFRAEGSGNWTMYSSLDGGATDAGTTINFSSAGQLTTSMPLTLAGLTVTTGANSPISVNLDFTGSTQYGSTFGVNSQSQDGYASGRLSSTTVNEDGTILGRYSNGQTRTLGQVVLANFSNPQGLVSVGSNMWLETPSSGQPLIGAAGSGNLGALTAGAVEESNVDLTAELVNMITAQRNYQANAQSIKTQDQVMQTLVNLR